MVYVRDFLRHRRSTDRRPRGCYLPHFRHHYHLRDLEVQVNHLSSRLQLHYQLYRV